MSATPSPLRLRLTIDLAYALKGENPAYLRERLHALATDASGNGLFTGDSPAEVETWTARVDDLPANALPSTYDRAALFATMPVPPDDMGNADGLAAYAEATLEWRARMGFPALYDGPIGPG